MRRESHVRFCESGGVRFPSATRPIWQQRNGSGRNVTFPARPFMVNGERRNFALLRAVDDRSAEDRLRQLVLEAYAEYQETVPEAAS
jgi:hypothetical protein